MSDRSLVARARSLGRRTPQLWRLILEGGGGDRRIDALALLSALFLGGALLLWAMSRQSDALYQVCAFDIWFGADLPRVISNMTDRWADHSRTTVHPLFSLLAFPPTEVLQRIFRLPPLLAAKSVLFVVDLLNISLTYLLARQLGVRPFGALLTTLIFIVSAASLFWFSVLETYAFGCATLLLALNVAAWRPERDSVSVHVGLWILTFGVTVTNVMAGVAASLTRFRPIELFKIGLIFLTAVFSLAFFQRALFPSAGFFFSPDLAGESRYVATYEGGAVAEAFERVRVLVVNTIFAPRAYTFTGDWDARGPFSAVGRAASVAEASVLLYLAIGAWLILMVAGLVVLARNWRRLPIALALLLLLAGQFALHMVYGVERFLYVGHFLPGFIALLALALRSSYARTAHVLAAFVLVVLIGVNLTEFEHAAGLARQAAAQATADGDACF